MRQIRIVKSGEATAPGEAYLENTPVLRSHVGTQPDLFLRWNAIPLSAAAVDIAVHLHGFSEEGRAMPLSEKVPRSGLDLSRRSRPTLAILPRGNWIRYRWYDFPALPAGGIDDLVDHALSVVSDAIGARAALQPDRLLLTAHSGGCMPALDILDGMRRKPEELFVFDGLYGRDPANGGPMAGLETLDGWLAGRFAAEPQRPGALRVVYIERQTGPLSRAVGERVARHLAAADPALRQSLARRYRVEPSGYPHPRIAQRCLPELLASAETVFDWSR